MKPVRLPASATLTLPRWGLIALSMLYILPGLIRRDPWKTDDAAGFGIMWTMAHGSWQDWLWPNIAGLPMPAEGPMAFWIGALCIKLFGFLLDDALAARISTIVFFLLGTLSIWRATFLLGRRAEAQPLRLAFGGQPEAHDYGRTLADGALLIYLGCLGLLLHSHETSAEALQISLVACSFYAAVSLFDTHKAVNALALGVSLGLLVLTRGWLVPLVLWLSLMGLAMITSRRHVLFLSCITLPFAIALGCAWYVLIELTPGLGISPIKAWLRWNQAQLAWPQGQSLYFLLKYGVWFMWPAWPFALWAMVTWRQQSRSLHIALPLTFLGPLLALALVNPSPGEAVLLPLLPALVTLAAFGLPTMKRGTINAVDWFSVMTLTVCAGFIWVGWIAKQTGWPAKIAHNAFKLAPGFRPEFNLAAFLIASAATLGWIALVHWRISRHPSVLWRAVVLSSGGVILCWLLLMTLWLPWLNYGKSYAGVAQEIEAQLPADDYCVWTNVGPAQRASFAYFGGVAFMRAPQAECDYMLFQDNTRRQPRSPELEEGNSAWKVVWEGRRPSDRDERFRLYQRVDQ